MILCMICKSWDKNVTHNKTKCEDLVYKLWSWSCFIRFRCFHRCIRRWEDILNEIFMNFMIWSSLVNCCWTKVSQHMLGKFIVFILWGNLSLFFKIKRKIWINRSLEELKMLRSSSLVLWWLHDSFSGRGRVWSIR